MKSLFVFLSLLIAFSSVAQNALDGLEGATGSDFVKYQKQLDSKQDQNIKGSKWLNRWSEFYSTRTNGSGELVFPEDYLKTAEQVAARKALYQVSRASDSSWSPEGPDTLVPAYSSFSSHGVARVNCIAFHPTDTNTFWVGVAQGGIWKTTNSGKSYTPINSNLPILRISDIAVDPTNPDVIYISVGDYAYLGVALSTDGRKRNTHYGLGVYKTTNGGSSWEKTGLSFDQTDFDQSLIRRVIIDPNNPRELVAAGISGVWTSGDAGATWTQTLNEVMWDIERNKFDAHVLIASSGYIHNLRLGNAAIWKSTDFGQTWVKSSSPLPATGVVQRVELSTTWADSSVCYAVTCDLDRGFHSFLMSTDAGGSWQYMAEKNTSPNILEWGAGNRTGGQGTYDLTLIADVNEVGRVFVGGVNVWGSPDSGNNWQGCSYWLRYYGFTPHADQHFFAYNTLDKKYYLCNDGGIFRTDTLKLGSFEEADTVPGYQFPTNWEDVSSGMQITAFYRVGTSTNNPGVLVSGAQDNGTFFRDTSGVWRNIYGGDGMDCFIDHDNPWEVYVSSQFGNIGYSNNNGRSVSNISNRSGAQGAWTTPMLPHPTTNNFYLGLTQVYQHFGGRSYNQLGFFPGGTTAPISAMDISDSNDTYLVAAKRVVYATSEPSQLFYTADHGGSWTDITSGLPDSLYFTSVKIDDRDPNVIWVTAGGFIDGIKVFESQDAGVTWTNKSMNLPNIPVNCIEQDEYSGNNALYLGTDVGVYYTNDSLSSWELYSKDLPNVIISDLEIHYTERRVYCSTFGRGIWSAEVLDTVFAFQGDTNQGPPAVIADLSWESADFVMAPNPNKGSFQVLYNQQWSDAWELSVIDGMGRRILQKDLSLVSGTGSFAVDLNVLPGVYYLRVSSDGRSKTLRFLVD